MADDKSKIKSSENEMGIGRIFFFLLLGVFIIWVMTGGSEKKTTNTKFFNKTSYPSNQEIPLYGK